MALLFIRVTPFYCDLSLLLHGRALFDGIFRISREEFRPARMRNLINHKLGRRTGFRYNVACARRIYRYCVRSA